MEDRFSIKPPNRISEKLSSENRRLIERIPTRFSLMYSGMYDGQMLIGNGIATNMSDSGIGVSGSHRVKLGMELALYIDFPGVEEPVCIAQTQVLWVMGCRFGIELLSPKHETRNELCFHMWKHAVRSFMRKP